MNRRKFIRTTTSALIYTVFGSTSEGKDDTHKDVRPNILFIMTDQQHAGMMSCTGNKWLKTPAMDSLARDGVRFERAYYANPVCVPRCACQAGIGPLQYCWIFGQICGFDSGSSQVDGQKR